MERHLLSDFGIEGELIIGYNPKKIYYAHAKNFYNNLKEKKYVRINFYDEYW